MKWKLNSEVFIKKTEQGTVLFEVSAEEKLLRLGGRLADLPDYLKTGRSLADVQSFLGNSAQAEEVLQALEYLRKHGIVSQV
jgi:hypothetical protein